MVSQGQTQGQTTVVISLRQNTELQITLYDRLGRKIQSQNKYTLIYSRIQSPGS